MSERRVKIVCTIGPASRSPAVLRALALAGMDVARLNFSHGAAAEHAAVARAVRAISSETRRPIAVMADLSGPKIRVGEIPGGRLTLRAGAELVLSARPRPPRAAAARGQRPTVGTTYRRLARDVGPGATILLDDGRLQLRVVSVRGDEVLCRVQEGGELLSHKGINLPGVRLSAPALTAKDVADLRTALALEADFIALSFVRRPEDVRRARQLIARFTPAARGGGRTAGGRTAGLAFAGPHPPVIAKLEKPEALERLEAILQEAGGVMVARGDLGVEISPERVPMAQKRIIALAVEMGRPVITATQMLESMTEQSRPTRAEASDVANAVLDGTDAVMLSAETASGRHPVAVVRMMDRIVRAAETAAPRRAQRDFRMLYDGGEFRSPEDAVSRAAITLAHALSGAPLVALTSTGLTALRIARRRPHVPVVALTPDERTARRLALVWGVIPRVFPRFRRLARAGARTDRALRELRLVRRGERVVLVMGYPLGGMGQTNLVKVHVVGESS